MARHTYFFCNGRSEGNAGMKGVLGANGAQTCEMASLGLPVSPGFCITTQCCQLQAQNGGKAPDEVRGAVKEALAEVQAATGRRFGNAADPLLVSVRGDAASPVPGVGGTVWNLGLNDDIVEAWAMKESRRFVLDCYRRLIAGYAKVVKHMDMQPFAQELEDARQRLDNKCRLGRRHADCHIPTHDLRKLVERYKEIYEAQAGERFPQDPEVQLWEAIQAVFSSWDSLEATEHREKYGVRGLVGAAATIQAMVFGNCDFSSVVGIATLGSNNADFSPEVHGEWLVNAGAEDFILRHRTPQKISMEASVAWAERAGVGKEERAQWYPSLQESMPSTYGELLHCQDIIRYHFGKAQAQSVEFAVQQGNLWVLQPSTMEPAPEPEPAVRCVIPPSPYDSELEREPSYHDKGTVYAIGDCVPVEDAGISGDATKDVAMVTLAAAGVQIRGSPLTGALIGESVLQHLRDLSRATTSTQILTRIIATSRARRLSRSMRLRHSASAVLDAWQTQGGQVEQSAAQALEEEHCGVCSGPIADDPLRATSPTRLPLWQTALAGGAANVAAKTVSAPFAAARSTGLFAGNLGACMRAFPTGAVCCSFYWNLCRLTPAHDSTDALASAWRLGSAAAAMAAANVLTYPLGSVQPRVPGEWITCNDVGRLLTAVARNGPQGIYRGLSPALRAAVPVGALELWSIDMARQAMLSDESEVSPGVLIASGAVAGTIAQTVVYPLNVLRVRGVSTISSTDGLASLYAGIGPAYLRSIPAVATNSLVRIGTLLYFSSHAD